MKNLDAELVDGILASGPGVPAGLSLHVPPRVLKQNPPSYPSGRRIDSRVNSVDTADQNQLEWLAQ